MCSSPGSVRSLSVPDLHRGRRLAAIQNQEGRVSPSTWQFERRIADGGQAEISSPSHISCLAYSCIATGRSVSCGLVAVQELLRPCPDYNDLAPLANRLMEVRSYGKGEPPAVPRLLRVLDLPTTSSECLGSGAPPDQPPRGRHRRTRPTATRRFSCATTRSRRHHPAGTDHGTGSPYHRPRPARTATARSAASGRVRRSSAGRPCVEKKVPSF